MYIFIHKYKNEGADDFSTLGLTDYFDEAELRGVQATDDQLKLYEASKDKPNQDVRAILIRQHHVSDLADCDLEACKGLFIHCHRDHLDERIEVFFRGFSPELKQMISSKSVSFTISGEEKDKLDFIQKLCDFLNSKCLNKENILAEALENLGHEHAERKEEKATQSTIHNTTPFSILFNGYLELGKDCKYKCVKDFLESYVKDYVEEYEKNTESEKEKPDDAAFYGLLEALKDECCRLLETRPK